MNHPRSSLRIAEPGEVESSHRSTDTAPGRPASRPSEAPLTDDSGQATAEYALVMMAAVTLAGLLIAWAASTDGVGRVMDAVINSLLGSVP